MRLKADSYLFKSVFTTSNDICKCCRVAKISTDSYIQFSSVQTSSQLYTVTVTR